MFGVSLVRPQTLGLWSVAENQHGIDSGGLRQFSALRLRSRLSRKSLLCGLARTGRNNAKSGNNCFQGCVYKIENALALFAVRDIPNSTLPRYSYYPFNLANSSEVDFLSAIAEAATINFVFISTSVNVSQQYRLKSWQSRQIKKMCEVGVNSIRNLPEYDFGNAVRDFESTTRIPQMFERVVSDDDLSKVVESARTESERVAPEKRALAQQVCRSFAQIIKARSAYLSDEQIKQLFTLRAALMFFVEFYREFDNYDDFADFVANAIAAKTKDVTALKNALEWPAQLDAAIKWIDLIIAAFEVNQDGVRNNFFDNLSGTLGDVARGRELTLPMLQGVFEPCSLYCLADPVALPRTIHASSTGNPQCRGLKLPERI